MNYDQMVMVPDSSGPSVRQYFPIDVDKLKQSLAGYLSELNPANRQVGLRWANGFTGVGDLRNQKSNPMGYKEADFNHWAPETDYLQEVSKNLGVSDHGRVRLLLLPPNVCYTFHRDAGWRLHIPLTTNKNSFIVVHGKLWHLPLGNSYLVNTDHEHTALNGGDTDRVHIVYGRNDNLLSMGT
jgi:hypothetical protein